MYRLTGLAVISILLVTTTIRANTKEQSTGIPDRSGTSLVSEVRGYFYQGKLKKGMVLLDSILLRDSSSAEVLYLRGESGLLSGQKEVLKVIEKLRSQGFQQYADILDLKTDLLLGDAGFPEKLKVLKDKYPGCYEIKFAQWLYRLDQGEYEWARNTMEEFAGKIIFGYIPYQALYLSALATNSKDAEGYYNTAVEKGYPMFTKLHNTQNALQKLPECSSGIEETTLPLVELGPYLGFELEDSSGSRIKVSLDTGTSGGGFTIHHKDVGERLSGGAPICLEKAIHYRYMKEPVDMYLKSVSFKNPPLKNVRVGYFEGDNFGHDGVFSPFAFNGLAITVDPFNKNVIFRNEAAMETYRAGLKRDFEEVGYINRFGWIFIPCKVNGNEVLMMVETGSRDVNVNSLAVQRYHIPLINSKSIWRGKEYIITRPDVTIEIGKFSYRPSDGFSEDFVMGSNMLGVASTGDIGPAFLRNFIFTIDPFRQKLILVKAPSSETGG